MKRNEELLDAFAGISNSYIMEAVPENNCKVIKRTRGKAFYIAAAVCAALLFAFPGRMLAESIKNRSINYILADKVRGNALSAYAEADKAKEGFELSCSRRFLGDVYLKTSESEKTKILSDFADFVSEPDDLLISTDCCFGDSLICTISGHRITVTPTEGKTRTSAGVFDEGSRILGFDTENNVYVLAVNSIESRSYIQKYNSDCEKTDEFEYPEENVMFSEMSGFDSLTKNEADNSLMLTYSNESCSGYVNFIRESEKSYIISISQDKGRLNQEIRITGGKNPEYISGDMLFESVDNSFKNKVLSSCFSDMKINTNLSEDKKYRKQNKERSFTSEDLNEKGIQDYIDLTYQDVHGLIEIYGFVGDSFSIESNKLGSDALKRLNESLKIKHIEAEDDGLGAAFFGFDGEKGYFALPEDSMVFYSFDRYGDLEKIADISFPVDFAFMFNHQGELRMGESAMYNGVCCCAADIVTEDNGFTRYVYCYDISKNKTKRITLPEDFVSEDDRMGIYHENICFIKNDGSVYTIDF